MINFIEIKDYRVLAGTEIKEAIEEAITLAMLNKCIVRFNFNSVEMEIYDFSNVMQQVEYYGRRLNENLK